MKTTIGCTLLLSVTIGLAAQQRRFDGKTWWHHVEVLADDNMEGRGTGSPGLQRAEAYAVDRLRRAGLLPAGVDGYYQPVSFESRQIVEEECEAALVREGTGERLVLGRDAVFWTLNDLAPAVDAPLVFVGYGLKVPDLNYDDFAGLDLKGKVAVAIPALPDGIDGPFAVIANGQRQRQYPETGLLGWIWPTPPTVDWPSAVAGARIPTMGPAGVDDTKGGRQIRMTFSPAATDALFQGTGHTAAELFGLARDHKPLPHFDMPVSIRTRTRVLRKRVESANVVAKLEGSDPQLKHEYIVLSAHIDHLGVGDPVNGDRIYNGAIDNASGVAALLDIADQLKRERVRPRRSVLFVLFTGEEPGMLGSRYFAAHPPVDVKSIVADVNVDSIQAFMPLTSVLVLGQEESDLGDAARRAISSHDVAVASEPNNRGICCSDQYSFLERGIPAVKLEVYFPGESNKVLQQWLRERVHKPSDDVHQPVDVRAAAKYEEILWQLILEIANDVHRPQWKSTSVYYKRYSAR
jgi:hypothetical protein